VKKKDSEKKRKVVADVIKYANTHIFKVTLITEQSLKPAVL
jgi:hypothetical protein